MSENTYGTQPKDVEYGDGGVTGVGAVRQQLLDAFEQFVDTMAHVYKPDVNGPSGGNADVSGGNGVSSATGAAHRTAVSAGSSYVGAPVAGSAGAGNTGGTGSVGKRGTSGSTGSMGKPISDSAGSHESTLTTHHLQSPAKAGDKAGRESSTGASGYPSRPEAGPQGTNGAGNSEARAKSVAGLREAYRLDLARETTRPARPRGVEAATATPAAVGVARGKHTRDSNQAPLREVREFAPAFGRSGRPRTANNEVIAARVSSFTRPETAPAPVQPGVKLDADWASYHTPLERAQERVRIAQAAMTEAIIGTDERVRVTNTRDYPFRCVCSLLITAQNGSQYLGTGWLVAPRLLLTAGHCVYMADEGGWVSQIEVIPGRDGDERPFGAVVATELRSVTGWTVDGDRDYDYGTILLPADRRLGDELGWLGYATRADDYFPGLDLNLAGYPGDGGPDHLDGTQWQDHRTVKQVNERQISYEIDTYGGQSGAPVWETTGTGDRYGLAIHTWGTSTSNGATRITSEVFDNIVAWAGEVP